MSIIAPALRRNRWSWIAAASAVLVGGSVALILYQATHRAPSVPQAETSVGPSTVSTPDIAQAAWRLDIRPQGAGGSLTKAAKAALVAQKPKVAQTIKELYDALFLAPEAVREVAGRSFSAGAARSLLAIKAGVPKGAEDVAITRRVARVSIDANGARFATARVAVEATGTMGGKDFKLNHNAHLWLERNGNRWIVIGFDVTQVPK